MDGGEEQMRARVVVDASGVSSSLARQAGLQPMRHPEDIAWAMEAEVMLPDLGEEMFFQYWIGSMAPGWKATFSPAGGDRATLGVFVRGHGQNVQPFFRGFLKIFKAYKKAQYRDIEDLKILSVRRGGDPICVLPGEIVADSLMVTGGAAAQSGLAYSMRAGTICGSVAAEAVAAGDVSGKALSSYEKLWKREFYWQYRMGRASLQTLATMKDEEIDQLVSGLSGKTLISPGSFAKKAAYAGAVVALFRPRTVLDLAANLMRG
jgi:digeranylgeranylglycerophospholipid reductase